MEKKCGLMEHLMKETIMKVEKMERESLFFKMVHIMKVNSNLTIYMVMVNITGLMVDTIKVIGYIIKCGVLVKQYGRMEDLMKEGMLCFYIDIKMIKSQV